MVIQQPVNCPVHHELAPIEAQASPAVVIACEYLGACDRLRDALDLLDQLLPGADTSAAEAAFHEAKRDAMLAHDVRWPDAWECDPVLRLLMERSFQIMARLTI